MRISKHSIGNFQLLHTVVTLCLFTIFFVFNSCKKDNALQDPIPNVTPVDTNTYGSLNVSLANVVGSRPLTLNDSSYSNQSGEKFNVSKYAYYISNIRLTAADGSVYTESESYHLINQSDSNSLSFTLNNIIVKEYTSITFVIGVDSLRNVSGAQTGALDPIHGMFWTWSTGYIMAKLEGKAEVSPVPGLQIAFHIAGFSGVNNVIKTINLPFPNNAVVSETNIPLVKMRSNLLEWFESPTLISFATLPSVLSSSPDAKMISDNYQDMFSVTQVIN